MKTFLGNPINQETLAILYLCDYDYAKQTITVTDETQFTRTFDCLLVYANTPNPASQMTSGKDRIAFEKNLNKLHARFNDPEWVKELSEYI